MRVAITGVGGFIGYNVARRFLKEGWGLTGIDEMNSYYDPKLKWARVNELQKFKEFTFIHEDICEISRLRYHHNFDDVDVIIHLAAQAGVRYALQYPWVYIHSNVEGTMNVLELCKKTKTPLLYASSSSVYGMNDVPFEETQKCSSPLTLYGATKLSCEHMAHAYSESFGVKSMGMRFFTVYGPWGRPDMAIHKFTDAIVADEPVRIFGKFVHRDFTFVDDIVEAIYLLAQKTFSTDVVNIGGGNPVPLIDVVHYLSKFLNKNPKIIIEEKLLGDISTTVACSNKLHELTGFRPRVRIQDGLKKFVSWYKAYYKVKK